MKTFKEYGSIVHGSAFSVGYTMSSQLCKSWTQSWRACGRVVF